MRLIPRLLLALACLPLTVAAAPPDWSRSQVSHEGPLEITVYRSPTCGCCHAWIEHLEAHGFTVEDVLTEDVASQKQRLGVPREMASCHTGVIDGYVATSQCGAVVGTLGRLELLGVGGEASRGRLAPGAAPACP